MNYDQIFGLMEDDPFKGDEKLKKDFISHIESKPKEKSMANKITHQDITAFTKLLVEIGGVLKVDDDYVIKLKDNDEPVMLSEENKEAAQIKIYHNNRQPGDYYVLNLFSESQFLRPEQRWFFDNAVQPTMAMTLVLIMRRIINIITDKDKKNDKLIKLSNMLAISDKASPSEKTKKEITSIDYKDIVSIFYKQSLKSGEIQSSLSDQEVRDKYKGITKKTWLFIDEIFTSLFNTTPDGISNLFQYTTVTIAAPKCEGHILLMYRYYKRLKDICDLLEIETCDMEEFADHARYIEQYQQLASWDDGLRNKTLKVLTPEVRDSKPTIQDTSYQKPSGVPKLNEGIYPSYVDMYEKPSFGGNKRDYNPFGRETNPFGGSVGFRTGKVPRV